MMGGVEVTAMAARGRGGSGTGVQHRHRGEAGFRAARVNPYVQGAHVVVYVAEAQGIDVQPDRYAVVCEAHGGICGANSMVDARALMRSVEFCEPCLAGGGEAAEAPLSGVALDDAVGASGSGSARTGA
jgi:hypothetical protein